MVELGEPFKRLSVLVNGMKIIFGDDLANERSLILNEVHGDYGDWLARYDQFNDLLVWQQEFFDRHIPAQDDMLQRLLQLQNLAEAADGLQQEGVRGLASPHPVIGAMTATCLSAPTLSVLALKKGKLR